MRCPGVHELVAVRVCVCQIRWEEFDRPSATENPILKGCAAFCVVENQKPAMVLYDTLYGRELSEPPFTPCYFVHQLLAPRCLQ